MHDNFMPLSGLIMMANMMLKVIVSGPSSGLFGIPLFAIVAVFAAGLNNARTHGFSELLYGYASGAATNGMPSAAD